MGRQPERGRQPIIWPKCPKTAWKRRKLDRGERPKFYYVDLLLHRAHWQIPPGWRLVLQSPPSGWRLSQKKSLIRHWSQNLLGCDPSCTQNAILKLLFNTNAAWIKTSHCIYFWQKSPCKNCKSLRFRCFGRKPICAAIWNIGTASKF